MNLLRDNIIKEMKAPVLWFLFIIALLGFLLYINNV